MAAHVESSSDGYVLHRGFTASARLNLQHYLWRQQVGYLLHPRILEAIPQRESIRIADIGTGTGIWLLDLSKELSSSAQLDGFDISLDQAPPAEWLPPNVTITALDSLRPVPRDLIGKYDVVHIRLFLLVVPNGDPTLVIQNVMHMLKPGGWIQWSELDFNEPKVLKARPECSTSAVEDVWQYQANMAKDQFKWVATIGDALGRHGFLSVSDEKCRFEKAYYTALYDVSLMVWEEYSMKALDRVDKERGGEARKLIAKAYEESKKSATLEIGRITAVGQKPLQI